MRDENHGDVPICCDRWGEHGYQPCSCTFSPSYCKYHPFKPRFQNQKTYIREPMARELLAQYLGVSTKLAFKEEMQLPRKMMPQLYLV